MAGGQYDVVFSYAFYEPLPQDRRMAGFSINLDTGDNLVYNTYDVQRRITSQYAFTLGPEIRERYFRMLNYAMPWLRHVPEAMLLHDGYRSVCTFGFHSVQMFRVYDLQDQMNLSFGSQRGHYSRLLFNLLQDISILLEPYGVYLAPDGFNWDPDVVSNADAPMWPQAANA